ncbi:AAC(3) family N-acetyltransferase [Myxococcota bacterium]|nr:AAC(3) family N-acetyltransferase [Myxococcota bacterium]
MVTSVHRLTSDLRQLGVAPGDVVMVHASLRKVGPVDGGAAGVVAAIDAAVGPEGTWMMVLGARDPWAWVNTRPEPERAALLADAEPFDPWTTPAEEDLGVLAEIFRQTEGTLVSDHPEGRFGARGRRAAELVANVPWDDYYGPGSPLARLVDADGKVLRLGADTNTVTLIHHAEYLAQVPEKRRARRHRRVKAPEGTTIRVVDCLDDSNGIVPWEGEDYFTLILTDYLAARAVPRGRVGGAPSELLSARDLVPFAADWMMRVFAQLGRAP